MNRRDILLGTGCVVAAGAAFELKPHRPQKLLNGEKLAQIVPMAFGGWTTVDTEGDGVVKPETAGTLAATLYNEIIARKYLNSDTDDRVMMLIAYGNTQSDLLQLHRPEVCYPAVGFSVLEARTVHLPVASGAVLPAREVVARKGDYQENILYWTRLGEYLQTTSGEQRKARLYSGMRGFLPDGGLFRFSIAGPNPETSFRSLKQFLPQLILAVPPAHRAGLVGTAMAHEISNVASTSISSDRTT